MYERTLIYLCLVLLICLGVLFLVDFRNIVGVSDATPNTYLQHNDVKGMAIEYKGLLYTLNFEEQNRVVEIINRALPVEKIERIEQKPDISNLMIYTFGKKGNLELKPLSIYNDDITFYTPKLIPQGYLMEVSAGELSALLANSHDP